MTEYFKIEGIPHQDYFKCERYSATLSVDACARMWRATNLEGSDSNMKCRICPLGAVHAGETAASISPLRGTLTCGRCHRVSTRLIGRHLCVSCYNREREIRIGKNAKGTRPNKLRPLNKRRIRYMAGRKIATLELEYSVATDELIVATLRDCPHRVVFSFRGDVRGRSHQMRLW